MKKCQLNRTKEKRNIFRISNLTYYSQFEPNIKYWNTAINLLKVPNRQKNLWFRSFDATKLLIVGKIQRNFDFSQITEKFYWIFAVEIYLYGQIKASNNLTWDTNVQNTTLKQASCCPHQAFLSHVPVCIIINSKSNYSIPSLFCVTLKNIIPENVS